MRAPVNYLKNITRSVTYAAWDIAREEMMPNAVELAESNKEFAKATYSALKNPVATVRKSVDAIQKSKVYQALDYGARNLVEDLRTGNFYNKEREDRDLARLAGMDADNWNDLSEFGIDDDWESQLNSSSSSQKDEVTTGDMKIVNAIEGSNAAATSTTVNAIIRTSNNSIQNSRANLGVIYMQNEKLFGGLHNDLSALNITMGNIQKITMESLSNIDKNISGFFTSEAKLSAERNAILKEMLDMQRQQFRSALDKERESASKRKSKKRWNDINMNGIPNIDAYFEAIKNNINEQVSTMGIPAFSEDSNMLATFMTSPLKGAVKYVVNGFIPATIKVATKELDNTLSGVFGNFIGALANAKNDDENSIMGLVAKFLGVSTSVNKSLDTGKYEKGPVPFDGITRKAIIDVIPTHLRRIEAALTGRQEEMFDYNSGRWVKMQNIKKQFENIHKSAVRSATSELQAAMRPGIKAMTTGGGTVSKAEADELEKAADEFWEYLYAMNGRFNPNATAQANRVEQSKYGNFYKHYDKIVKIYKNAGQPADTSTATDKKRPTYSVKMRVPVNVLSAKDSEERQYREMESSVSNIFHQYFGAPNADTHGKYDSKEKFGAFNILNNTKDSLGNTVFNYLQNINKELSWQRMEWGIGGKGDTDYVPSGKSKGSKKAGKSKKYTPTNIDAINLSKSNNNTYDAEIQRRQNEDNRAKTKALELINSGKAIDLRDFDVDQQQYLLSLAAMVRRNATDEYAREVRGYVDESALSSFMDKHFYKTNVRSIEDVRKVIDQANKEGKNTSDIKLDNNEEKFFKKLIGKIGANGVIGGITSASADVFTNLIYTADKAIYEMMYKTELKTEGESEKYNGFMDMISHKVENTFDKMQKSIEENIIKPFKDRLGVDDKFEDRFKESLTKMGTGFSDIFLKSNKDVYGPAYHEMMRMMGIEKEETLAQKKRAKNRDEIAGKIKYAQKEDSLISDDFIKLLADNGLNFSSYDSIEDAKADLFPLLYEQMYKQSKGLSELYDNEEYIGYASEYASTDMKLMKKLADKYGIELTGSTEEDIARSFKAAMKTKLQNNKGTRDARSRAISKGGDTLQTYAERSGFVGTVEEKKQLLLDMGVPKEQVDKLKNDEMLNKRFARLKRDKHAEGTFGVPFMGNTMLSKGELLFNSKGVGMVNKTDAYTIDEPTHILNSGDSHDLLSALGVKGLDPKTTIQDDLGREKIAQKKIFNNAKGNMEVSKTLDTKTIIEQAKQYVPEGLAGGLVGGIVSTLFGLVGGPLVGAAIGAGSSIIANSDTLKEKLFGKLNDGKRDGSGIVSKTIMDAVQKYAPNMLKFGMAGIIPGLITPLGPIGGLMAGAAIGYIKSNEKIKEKYFGENGELAISSKEKKIIQDMLPNTLKGAAVGAGVKLLFGGPFGLLGNAAVGAAVGMMTSTEEFKDGLLGTEINGKRMGGVIGAVKDAFKPLADAGNEFKTRLNDAIETNLVQPLKQFLVPAIHALPQVASIIPRKLNEYFEDKFNRGLDTITKSIVGGLSKLFKPAAWLGNTAFKIATLPVRGLGAAGRAIEKKQIKTMNADYRTASERLAMMGDENYNNRKMDEMLADIGSKNGFSTDEARSMMNDLNVLYDTERSMTNAKVGQNKKIMSILNDYKTEDGKSISYDTKKKIKQALDSGNTAQIPYILQNNKLKGSDHGLTQDQANALLEGDGLMAELNKYSDYDDRRKRAKGATTELRDEASKNLAKTFEDLGINIDLSNSREVLKLSKYLQTEITRNEANPDAEGKKDPISDENNKNLREVKDDVHDMVQLFKYIATGDDEYLKGIKKDREDNTADAMNRMQKRYQSVFEQNAQEMGDETDEFGRTNAGKLSPEAADAFTASGKSITKMAKQIADGTLTTDEVNAMNEHDEDGNLVSGSNDTKRLVKVKDMGYYCDNDLIQSINKLDAAQFKFVCSMLKNKWIKQLVHGRSLNNNDIDFFLKYHPQKKIVFQRAEILVRSGENGSTFTDLSKIMELTGDEIAKRSDSIERTKGEKAAAKVKSAAKVTRRFTKAVGKKVLHLPGYVIKDIKDDLKYMDDASADNLFEGGKYGDEVKPKPEKKPEDDVANNGIGTFLLNSLFKGVTGIGKAAVGGVKSLFGKKSEDPATEQSKANGVLSSIFGGNKSKDINALQNTDEVDKPGDGRDVANFGDGLFGLIKRDSSGNIEPDTSDSGTKAAMNKLSLKEKAQQKLQEAQLKACEVIKANFDTSNIKASKKGKLGWLSLLLMGGYLVKTGVLKTLFENVVKPLWTEGIKPWIDTKVIPWWNETAKPWILNTAIPKIGEFFTTAISGIGDVIKAVLPEILSTAIENLPSAIATAFGIGAKTLDLVLGNETNAGGKTVVDTSKLSGQTGMTDENGNTLSAEDVRNGNFEKIYNAQGVEGTIDENGNPVFEDQSLPGSSTALRVANASAHAFAHGNAGIFTKMVSKGSSLVSKLGISGKLAGTAGKIITKPVEWAGKAGKAFANGFDKLAGKTVTEAAESAAENAAESATTKVVEKAVGKTVSEATENKSLVSKILTKCKDIIDKLFSNSKVAAKLSSAAEALGAKNALNWIKNFKTKVNKVFEEAAEKVSSKVQNSILKKAAGKVNLIMSVASLVIDFLTGCDQAEAILGVTNASAPEAVVAGIINSVVNATVIFSIVPGVNWIAQKLFSFFDENLEERQKEADAELEQYNNDNGTSYSKEEYLKQQYSYTGKIGGWISNAGKSIVGGVKTVVGGVIDVTKNTLNSVVGTATSGYEGVKDLITGKTTLKDVASSALNMGSGALSVSKDMMSLLLDGDFKGLINYKTNNDGSFSGQLGSLINNIGKFALIPMTGVSSVIHTVGDGIGNAIGAGSVVTGVTDTIKTYGSTILSGDIEGLLSYQPNDGSTILGKVGNVLANIGKVAVIVPTGISYAVHHIGNIIETVSGFAGDTKDAFNDTFTNFSKFVIDGDLEGLITYNPTSGETIMGKIGNAVAGIGKVLVTPGVLISKGVHTIASGFAAINKALSSLESNSTEEAIEKAKSGEISIFSKEYWASDDSEEDGFAGAVKKMYNNFIKVINAPILLVEGAVNSLVDGIVNIADWIQGKFDAVGDFFDDPVGFIYNSITGGSEEPEGSTTHTSTSGTTHGGSGNTSTTTTDPAYGMGYSKQIDPSIANARYNGSGDSVYQTIGDSGCGPTAAVNALESLYGRGGNSVIDAANYAVSRGYKEVDGGTKPAFFTDYFNRAGYGATTSYNKADIEKNINSGMPTVLMGTDARGTSTSTPFGKTPHYVTVTGTDENGRAIVQDPESKYDNQLYDVKDLMSKTTLGVSAYGKNYKPKYGRATADADNIGGFFKDVLNNSAAGRIFSSLTGSSSDSSSSSSSDSTSSSVTASGSGNFPKYQLSDDQIKGIANIVEHEQPGKSGYMAEASLMANLTDKGGDDAATVDNLVATATGGWFAYGKDRFYNYGNPSQDAIDAVKEVIVNGKRTLPRYVDEHDCFSDISSASTDGVSFSPSDRSKYVQFKTKIQNTYGSSGTFYGFPNDEADPFYYTSEDLRTKWGEDFYQASGSGGNGNKPKSKFGRSKWGLGNRASEVWYFLKKKGFSDEAAAGVLGNMEQESGVDPTAIQGGGKGPAAGIVQWENYTTKSSRWKAMSDYASSQGKDWTDLGSQLEWMWQELNGKDSTTKSILDSNGGISALTNATDAHAAADLFEKSFERAGTPMMNNRYTAADKYLSQLKGTQGTEISGVTAESSSSSDSSSSNTATVDTIGSFLKNIMNNSPAGKILNSLLGTSSSSSSSDSSSSSSGTVTAAGDAAKVVQVAQQEVGVKETPENYVKYNDWYWGEGKGGADLPWCAAFTSWVGNQAGVPESIIPKDAYTVTAYNTLVSNGGKIANSQAQPGDIAYFTNNGSASGIYHTGIVESVNNGIIGTIEGNSSDMVKRHQYEVSNSKLLIAHPQYANSSSSTTTTTTTATTSTSTEDAPDVSNTLGGNGIKPMSKFGTFKDNLYGKGTTNNTKVKLSAKDGYHTVEYSAMDRAAGEALKSQGRKNVYTNYGMGTTKAPRFGKATGTDYTKLINSIINILMTIANNTDKLNTIISILNDKLGVSITEQDVSDKTGTVETLKMKLAGALGANSAIDTSNLSGFADNSGDNAGVQAIISAMNAIASE